MATAFLILFHPLRSTDDFTAAVFIDPDSHKDRDILYLAAPAALEIDTVYIDIRISAGKRVGTPLFDMLIRFFVEVAYRTMRHFGSPESFCDILHTTYKNSSKIHLNQASSTEDSLRR